MGDTENREDALLTLKAPRKLELKKTIGLGQVRQSFSRGRTKPVAVEVKKKRTVGRDAAAATPVRTPPPQEVLAPLPPDAASQDLEASARPRVVLKALTEDEKVARARALDDARSRDEDVRRRVAEQARRQQEEEAQLAREHEQAERRKELEEARKREEEEARKKAEETAARKLTEPDADERQEPRRGRRDLPRRPAAPRRLGGDRRRAGKLTLTQALNEDERVRSLASVRRQRERERRLQTDGQPPRKVTRDVIIPETISVLELANRMAERAADVVSALARAGETVDVDTVIEADVAEVIAGEFGHRVRRVSDADVEIGSAGRKTRRRL